MILTLTISSREATPDVTGGKYYTALGSMMEYYAKKTRLYLSMCYINRKVLLSWTCQKGFRVKELINWTLTWYGPLFSWLICLPPFSSLIHLLILCLFSSWYCDPNMLQSFCLILLILWTCFVVILWFNVCGDIPDGQLFCHGYLRSCNMIF